jgi:hypothetical protein
MIVTTNSDFLTDAGVQQNETGLDFGLNSINWLLNRESGAVLEFRRRKRNSSRCHSMKPSYATRFGVMVRCLACRPLRGHLLVAARN